MTTTFRKALRENVGLWINLIAGTGAGKTYTGMKLAEGIAGDKPFAVIDTENRRALHYADKFRFDHAELRAPFRPDAYAEAIKAADAAGYPVIMVDSGSHVWNGDGGVLDWQEDEQDAMVKRAKDRNDSRPEWQIREGGKMSAWIAPKKAHKQMVSAMLQCRAHLILCLRAEQKIEMVKEGNKWVIQQKQSLVGRDGWIPLCDKNLPFEATCSLLLLASNPGVPLPIKLQDQHKELFPLDKPIATETGRKLAEWAAGGARPTPGAPTAPESGAAYVTADQAIELDDLITEAGAAKGKILETAGVKSLAALPAADYPELKSMLQGRIQRKKAGASASA